MSKSEERPKIPTQNLDPAGLLGELFVVYAQEGDTQHTDRIKLSDKSKREFFVEALLGKHSESRDDIRMSILDGAGESYIKAHPDALVTKLYTSTEEIFIKHNKNRELCVAEYSCQATTASEAREKFLSSFSLYLDHTSYVANIPIHITQITIHDKKHEIRSTIYTSPYSPVVLNAHSADIHNDLLPIYALYREAKNSNSPFYKFLCYYKILEGVYLSLRPELFKLASEKDVKITTVKEKVPSNKYIEGHYSKFIDEPIKKIFDERFQVRFRNKIAHFLLDATSPLNVSDFGVFQDFGKEVGLIEACARVVVETHSQYLSEYYELINI